jgi:hypothetical protein
MNTLALARLRAARRHQQGGVAMFIVTMMMTVLATVGLFALAAAATEVKTAGNERQSTQAHYLADYGIIAIAHNTDGANASFYTKRMLPTQKCMSLPIPTSAVTFDATTTSCGLFEMTDFQTAGSWSSSIPPTVTYAGTAPYQASIAPGSLGPVPTTAAFVVELTDANSVTAPGYSPGLSVQFVMVTATAMGLTLPSFAGAAAYGNEGIETQRARIIAGPILK